LEPRDLRREITELRNQLRRNQVYLTAALAMIGLGTLVSIGLVAYYGLRLGEQVWEVREDVVSLEDESRTRTKALSLDLARQEQELAAIRKAANDEMVAIQEAHRKIAAISDPRKELQALREANEALWTELATQRADLLDALAEQETASSSPAPAGRARRFALGETSYVDPRHQPNEIKGFIKGDERVYQAHKLRGNPAHLLIEVSPQEVQLGDPYRLAVRLVNRSNQPLDADALRLDWSFGGKNTGGAVPLGVGRIGARKTAVLYQMSAQWTPAHEDGPVVVTATLRLHGGELLANSLRW
jgi:hypothetical protein